MASTIKAFIYEIDTGKINLEYVTKEKEWHIKSMDTVYSIKKDSGQPTD